MAVSAGWEEEEEGGESVGERSTDLCFFLWGGGPEPSWSDRNNYRINVQIHENLLVIGFRNTLGVGN